LITGLVCNTGNKRNHKQAEARKGPVASGTESWAKKKRVAPQSDCEKRKPGHVPRLERIERRKRNDAVT